LQKYQASIKSHTLLLQLKATADFLAAWLGKKKKKKDIWEGLHRTEKLNLKGTPFK